MWSWWWWLWSIKVTLFLNKWNISIPIYFFLFLTWKWNSFRHSHLLFAAVKEMKTRLSHCLSTRHLDFRQNIFKKSNLSINLQLGAKHRTGHWGYWNKKWRLIPWGKRESMGGGREIRHSATRLSSCRVVRMKYSVAIPPARLWDTH